MSILLKRLKDNSLVKSEYIRNNLELINSINFKFKGVDLKNVMMQKVFYNLKDRYVTDLKEILYAETFISKNKIKKCLVNDEGDRARGFMIAGNRLNIKTYAVQHGIINSVSPGYIINSKYKDLLVPQKTFIWGDRYKELLINSTNIYNDSNIKVVGQVRTDFISQYKNNNSKESNKIKILYATQYFEDLLKPATEMLFKALNLLEQEYEIVIKLHPADDYWKFYKEMIREYNISNATLVKDGDLYEFISNSYIIVSVHSTVVLEGVLLDKPSVCIVLPKYNDAGGFIKDGISLGAKDEIDLADCLSNIASKKVELKSNLDKYIYENFYYVDGKVTDRIIIDIET